MPRKQLKSIYPNWSKNISKWFPKFNLSPDTVQLYANFMIFIAIMGCFPIAFQALRVYRTKDAKSISIPAFAFQVFISTSWIIYALLIGNGIIVISSTLIIIAALTLVFLTWKHSSENKD